MNRRWLRSAIGDRDADQHIVGRCFGILNKNIEVAIVIERARINELELRIGLAAPTILLDELRVRELALRILVQRLHVRVRPRRVEVVKALLHIFAVVALVAREAEQPLLENRVAAIPQRERETEPALAVANAEKSILAPTIGATASLVV